MSTHGRLITGRVVLATVLFACVALWALAPSVALAVEPAGAATAPTPLVTSLDGAAFDGSGATLRVDSPAGIRDVDMDYGQLLSAVGAGLHDGRIGVEDLIIVPFLLGVAFRTFSYLSRLSRI